MDTQKLIVDKITAVLDSTDKNQSAELKKLIDHAGHIFVAGAGRSKLVSSFLAMRLVHCGYNVKYGWRNCDTRSEGRRFIYRNFWVWWN